MRDFRAAMAAMAPVPGYHEVVHDHFNNPRNVGSLEKEDVGSLVGDVGGSPIAGWFIDI